MNLSEESLSILWILSGISVIQSKLRNGIVDFEEATPSSSGKLVYDSSKDFASKYNSDGNLYRVVSDMCITDDHHDIIDYYSGVFAYFDPEGEFGFVQFNLGDGIFIVIDEESWSLLN